DGGSASALVRSRPVTTERARNLVEPIDLGEDLIHILVEHAIEIDSRVGARALEMLNAEADWRQRVLDLVGDLARHLAPREDALRPRELGHVVDRNDGAATAQPREWAAQLPRAERDRKILILTLRGEKTLNDFAHRLAALGRAVEGRSRSERRVEQRLGAGIRQKNPALGVDGDDAARDVTQHRRGSTLRFLER